MAAWLGAWFARALQQQVEYLRAENQTIKEKLGDRTLQLTDADRCRLAVLGKELGCEVLAKVLDPEQSDYGEECQPTMSNAQIAPAYADYPGAVATV